MVGARAPVRRIFDVSNAYKKKKRGGGVTHRSWPGGQGGKPGALVAGEGWGGGVRAGWQFQREGWLQTLERRPLGPPLGPRLGLGGVQGLRCRGGRWRIGGGGGAGWQFQ